ncbi:hypothetical protein GCM10027404_11150 [Arthrobacter tumbae]|uniref:hypothetical protein n=1 Tax=Arthrobacter tumbae TaxID=163874 RepID=UPI00195A2475|nr:hypothetical protein [Arthrobacter tumbae]MBM7782395.1 hypothetical protein [Arthrobacter tumbae]
MNKPAPSDPAARPAKPSGQPSPPSDKDIASTRALLRVFMLLLLGTLLGTSFPLPWKVLGLVFGLAAVTVGIIALVGLVRQKAPTLLRISTTVGLVASLFLTLGAGATILLWPVTEQYEECTATALTSKAQRECDEDLRNLGGLLGVHSPSVERVSPWSTS